MAKGKKRRPATQRPRAAPAPPPPAERPALSPRMLGVVVLLLVVTAAGAYLAFGSGAGEDEDARSDPGLLRAPWVDPDGISPIVGSVDVNPGDGSLWFSTNTGLWRVARGAERPERVTGTLTTELGSGRISQELVIRFRGPDDIIASGHPPPGSELPQALGIIESDDGGRTWTAISEVGRADFHAIQLSRRTVVAGLFGEALVNVSRDGGRTLEPRTPPAPLIDLEVDPDDPRRWIGSTAEGLVVSGDEGRTWRQLEPIPNSRFSWPESDALYRIDPGGPVKFSTDGGRRWEERGSTGGEPQAMFADGVDRLYVALLDGTIKESRDGGRTWTDRVTPASTPG